MYIDACSSESVYIHIFQSSASYMNADDQHVGRRTFATPAQRARRQLVSQVAQRSLALTFARFLIMARVTSRFAAAFWIMALVTRTKRLTCFVVKRSGRPLFEAFQFLSKARYTLVLLRPTARAILVTGSLMTALRRRMMCTSLAVRGTRRCFAFTSSAFAFARVLLTILEPSRREKEAKGFECLSNQNSSRTCVRICWPACKKLS